MDDHGKYNGSNTTYHIKYCDVQTLLNVTNANVCANIVDGRSHFANASGIIPPESRSCGRKGIEEYGIDESPPGEEVRYMRTLYGEKLWRWSTRVRWWR
jgi:hypothetical protein